MIGDPIRSSEGELPRDLNQSLFLLRKSSSNSTASVQVDFSPLSEKTQPSPCSAKSLPTFNADGFFFTPSFILGVDEERYRENQELYSKIHNRKVIQISEQKTELFLPRPSKNNSYCCVCRTPFEDYLTHTNTPRHHFLAGQSDYTFRIKQLCLQFRPKEPAIKKKRGRPAKTKPIEKIYRKESAESTGDEQKVSIQA